MEAGEAGAGGEERTDEATGAKESDISGEHNNAECSRSIKRKTSSRPYKTTLAILIIPRVITGSSLQDYSSGECTIQAIGQIRALDIWTHLARMRCTAAAQ